MHVFQTCAIPCGHRNSASVLWTRVDLVGCLFAIDLVKSAMVRSGGVLGPVVLQEWEEFISAVVGEVHPRAVEPDQFCGAGDQVE